MSEKISYEEYLDRYGSLTYSVTGVSMLPLLREGKDLFTVSKPDLSRLKRGDVILYRRAPDKYVLHRIVGISSGGCVTLGDNCVNREYGVSDRDIIGVMTGFVRNGREHGTDEKGYRLYSFVRMNTAGVRIFFKKLGTRLTRFSGKGGNANDG